MMSSKNKSKAYFFFDFILYFKCQFRTKTCNMPMYYACSNIDFTRQQADSSPDGIRLPSHIDRYRCLLSTLLSKPVASAAGIGMAVA